MMSTPDCKIEKGRDKKEDVVLGYKLLTTTEEAVTTTGGKRQTCDSM